MLENRQDVLDTDFNSDNALGAELSNRYKLQMKNIWKIFPGVKALESVDFDLRSGEIHCLIGPNGSGKSTLIKIISGVHNQDKGEVILEGKKLEHYNPIEAISLGIATVYQDVLLVPSMSVVDNMFLGREMTKGGVLSRKKQLDIVHNELAEFNRNIDPNTLIEDLSTSDQQIVAIAKNIFTQCKILILDEPSAILGGKDLDILFEDLKKLKTKGVGIIYISHRLEEIFSIGDRVTVLRDGLKINTVDVSETSIDQLVQCMAAGKCVEPSDVKEKRVRRKVSDEVVMSVRKVNSNILKNISFDLKKGEILGFAGLVGAGRSEIVQILGGADVQYSGDIILHDKNINYMNCPRDALNLGIALLPEDRKKEGLILCRSAEENLSISILKEYLRADFFIKVRDLLKNFIFFKKKLNIKIDQPKRLIATLSGGNQQKVIFGRLLATNAEILLLDEPTTGIDVLAKREIFQLVREIADEGKSIIFISSELPEVVDVCDRILVLHQGEIVGNVFPNDVTQEDILRLAIVGKENNNNKEKVRG